MVYFYVLWSIKSNSICFSFRKKKFFQLKFLKIQGCKTCYKIDRNVEITPDGRTVEDLFEATERRKFHLEKKGYRVLEVRECKWKALLKQNGQLRKHWDQTFVAPPFMPRVHALRGGRVEVFKLYAESNADEIIEHFDVV